MADEDDDVIVVDADQVDDTDGKADLGDAGKKALDSMKAKWQKERDGRKALEARLAELEKKDDGDKPDPEKLRAEAKAEARAEALKERALDKIEAKAAKLFADPEDAVALLGRRVDEFIDGGQLDIDAIEDALAELLKKKPHLAAAQGGNGAKRFTGTADGGARKGSRADQLTRQDLKKMTPQQIVKAQADGRLNDLMGVDT